MFVRDLSVASHRKCTQANLDGERCFLEAYRCFTAFEDKEYRQSQRGLEPGALEANHWLSLRPYTSPQVHLFLSSSNSSLAIGALGLNELLPNALFAPSLHANSIFLTFSFGGGKKIISLHRDSGK